MNRKKILITLLFMIGITSAAIGINHSSAGNAQSAQGKTIRQQDVYEHLFRHFIFTKNKSKELERAGKDGKSLRNLYKDKAKLTEREVELLDQAATDCLRRVSDLQARADGIIAVARERVPSGRLKKGEKPPPPPAELEYLQAEREDAVLQARERLRSNFGETSFARFDEFVQRNIAANLRGVEPRVEHHAKDRTKSKK